MCLSGSDPFRSRCPLIRCGFIHAKNALIGKSIVSSMAANATWTVIWLTISTNLEILGQGCKIFSNFRDYLIKSMKSDMDQSSREATFLRIVEIYGAPIRRLCAAYSRDMSRRQDLFQEIAIAIWTALPNFRRESSERTWVYRIAHNIALSHISRHSRLQRSEQPFDTLRRDPVVEEDYRHKALVEAVQQLKPSERNVILLYLEGLSGREIADITGLTVDNIGVRLNRIRQKLSVAVRGKEGVNESAS